MHLPAAGAFSLQGSGAASEATSGTYLSHVCNADSTFDAVWAVSTYTSSGGVGTPSYYCAPRLLCRISLGDSKSRRRPTPNIAVAGEHGLVNSTTGVYTSYAMQTMTCPLTAPYTGATTSTSTEVQGTSLSLPAGCMCCLCAAHRSALGSQVQRPCKAARPVLLHGGLAGFTSSTNAALSAALSLTVP